MNNLVKCILLFFILFSLTLNARNLKIAITSDMAPYSFVNSNNELSGFLVDYWLLWSKKTGHKVDFVISSWNESLANIENNKCDIHSGLFKSPDRKKHIKYLNKIYNSNSNLYIINDENINNISHLDGKTVGFLKGTYYENYFFKNYPLIKTKSYLSYKEFNKDVQTNKIDAFIDDNVISWMNIIRYFDYNKVRKIEDFSLNNWFYAGINKKNKNNKILEKIIINGMNKISIKDLKVLEQKWIINKELQNLSQIEDNDILNIEERIYLNNNQNIQFALVKGWKLMSFYDDNMKMNGFHIDLLKQINKNLNTKIKYKVYDNWFKAYDASKNKEINGIFGLSWTKEREKFFHYSASYFFSPYYLVTRLNDNSILDIKDLNNKIAIVQKNSISEKIIKQNSPNVKILYAKNQIDNLKKIQNGIADFTIKEDAYEYDIERYNLSIKKTFFTKEGELYIGTSKKDKILASIINKGLKSISQNQINIIKDKWRNKKVKKSVFTKEELKYIKESKILNVGIENRKPVIYTDDSKNLEGLAGEIIELAFKHSGLKINLVKNNWHQLLKDFKNKKIDILPATYYVDKRKSFGLYSDSYLNIRNYLYVKENNSSIHSFNDLKGKSIALIKDDGNVALIKAKFPNINIVETLNIEESILKIINDEVDAIYESQIVIENKLKDLLIKGLKTIPHNDLKINKMHIFSKKDDLILQSILQKSLYLVSIEEKNRIISKWIKNNNIKKELNLIFPEAREPFIFKDSYLKGIEFDLIKEIFKDYDIKINYSNVDFEKQYNIFKNNNFYDIAVSMKKNDDEFYYSNDYINFSNVFITRVKDNITINSLDDLKGKKIIAFEKAYKYSGKDFYNMFSQNIKNYKEISDTKKAVQEFLNNKADIIFIDINIFKWHLKYLSDKSILTYKFDFLKDSNNTFQVAFKDENLKNVFNENLAKIKNTGKYQKIINSYVLYDKKAKIEVLTLLSKLLSKYIFDRNTEELKNIVNIFSNLEYINKIEVYNKNDELLIRSSQKDMIDGTLFDSFYFIHNFAKRVGYIKVYFDEEVLSFFSSNNNLIPEITYFKNLNSYSYVKGIYNELFYLSSKVKFTKKERLYIKENPIVKFSEINIKPLFIIENNKASGLLKDYIKIIEDKTSLKFKFIEKDNSSDVIKSFKNEELDILPSYSSLELPIPNSILSNIYESFNYIVVTKDHARFSDNISDFKNKTLALPKYFTAYNFIKKNYPNINVIETKTIREAFELIAKGKADATIEHSALASYYIKTFFPSLKVSGVLENKYNHSFLIQKENPELLSIINKVVDSISFEKKREIRDKWIKTKIDTSVDYKIIYEIIFTFIIILLIILYFLKRISKNKNDIEKINLKLKDSINNLYLTKNELENSNVVLHKTIINLNETKDRLIDAEKMAALGALVAGVAHEINTPIGIGLTGISHLDELTKKINNNYIDERMTQDEFEDYLSISKELSSLIYKNLEKAATLVSSFKQVAVDQSSEEKREFNLKDYLDEILQSIHSVTKKANVKIEINCPFDIILNSYAGAYSQIITNLIMNSLIHGFDNKEKGNISINIEKELNELKIIYKDNGKGISGKNLGKIFDPFFTTNRDNGGSGLGLNIIYNIIISRLNGSIKCKSQDNNGVEFIIILNV
ncbi:MAG: transporter substrate-binding domain-containing protein [Campylobacterales bacterium]|nr:transporter substrate-binding domain-containing protein [Campylobacterales bacterium]